VWRGLSTELSTNPRLDWRFPSADPGARNEILSIITNF
jgi:hypothetical protein